MEDCYRFEIYELIAKYRREPSLRDLYVEGPSDKHFFHSYFQRLGTQDVSIYEINQANVSPELINTYSLQSKNRDRVVVLALEFEKNLDPRASSVYCIADMDFNFVLGEVTKCSKLLYTDCTSLEVYFCNLHIIEKIFNGIIGKVPKNVASMFGNIIRALEEIFYVRAANEKLEWYCKSLPILNHCRIENNNVVFNINDFIHKYLSKNKRLSKKNEFLDSLQSLKKKNLTSYRYKIRGKDFIVLFGKYIAKVVGKGGNKYQSEEVVRSLIIDVADFSLLSTEKFFKDLLQIYG